VYSAGLNLDTLLPRLTRVTATALVGFASLLLLLIYLGALVLDAQESITAMTILLVAIGTPWAVVVGIGLIACRGVYLDDDLQVFNRGQRGGAYWFTEGWNPRAIVAWLTGATFGAFAVNTTLYKGPLADIADGVDVSFLGAGAIAGSLPGLTHAVSGASRGRGVGPVRSRTGRRPFPNFIRGRNTPRGVVADPSMRNVAELGLIDPALSLLVVIDTQEGFVARLESERRQPFVSRVAFLIGVAGRLGIPVVTTVETPDQMGGLPAEVTQQLPAGCALYRKPVFGLAADAEIMSAIQGSERECVVLTGMETDVCVLHSAIGLREAGFRVAVVRDAVQSPGDAHEFGLDRLRQLGIELVSTKGLFYEWLRTVDAAYEFESEHPDLKAPEDLIL
jgi:nicotinamidase-related amidase